ADARSPGAFVVAQPPQLPVESLVIAASNVSLAPFPVVGSDSQGSSRCRRPFTPASADLMWHLITVAMYLLIAFATPSSQFPVAASGGTVPASSLPAKRVAPARWTP